ncbi:MAG: hypothetical protein ACYDAO_10510 [Thermoplasmataceae archaeon]
MTNNLKPLLEILSEVSRFSHESRKMLSKIETSGERIITIEEAYKELTSLNLRQDELIRESLKCIEVGLFRAAHVLSWSAMSDFLTNLLALKLNKDIDAIREQFNDNRILEQLRANGLISKSLEKSLKGLLNKRDECGHPSDYFPELDQTLGYVREILSRISYIISKSNI